MSKETALTVAAPQSLIPSNIAELESMAYVDVESYERPAEPEKEEWDWADAILETSTHEELSALAPQLNKLTGDERTEAKALHTKHKATLQGES